MDGGRLFIQFYLVPHCHWLSLLGGGGGGEAYSFGGEASPLPPPVDRTLPMMRGVMSLVVRP